MCLGSVLELLLRASSPTELKVWYFPASVWHSAPWCGPFIFFTNKSIQLHSAEIQNFSVQGIVLRLFLKMSVFYLSSSASPQNTPFEGIAKYAFIKQSSLLPDLLLLSPMLLHIAVGSDPALNTGAQPNVFMCNCRFQSLWEPLSFVCTCKRLQRKELRWVTMSQQRVF